jgi:hypothetical protein
MSKGCKFVHDVAVCMCSYVDEKTVIKVMGFIEGKRRGRDFLISPCLWKYKHVLK